MCGGYIMSHRGVAHAGLGLAAHSVRLSALLLLPQHLLVADLLRAGAEVTVTDTLPDNIGSARLNFLPQFSTKPGDR